MQEIDREAATEGVHRKTLVLESLFNKFYQKETPTQYFPENIVEHLRTPILKRVC